MAASTRFSRVRDVLLLKGDARREARVLMALAAPVMLTYLLGFAIQITTVTLMGHVSELAMAAGALAVMYANATGHSILLGTTSALDTLSSQAYGAGNYTRVGKIAFCGIFIMLCLCVPIAGAWMLAAPAVRLLGQDPGVVEFTARFVHYLLPGLPAAAVYEVLKKHMQALNIMVPAMVIQAISVCISAVAGVVLVFYTPAGFIGAPIAVCIAQWSMLLLAVLYFFKHRAINTTVRRTALARWYMKSATSSSSSDKEAAKGVEPVPSPIPHVDTVMHHQSVGSTGAMSVSDPIQNSPVDVHTHDAAHAATTAAGVVIITDIDDLLDATMPVVSFEEVRKGWKEFLALGLPSAAMLMAEWGSFEAAAIVAGLVSTTALAAHSIMSTTSSLCFMPMLGLSVAAGIRIGQRMGENKPREALLTYAISMYMTFGYIVFMMATVLAVQPVWGRAFTNDEDVVDLIGSWLFMLGVYMIFDAFMCVCCGIMRGVGRPALAAAANIVSYLVIGLCFSYTFAIIAHLGLPGVWMGFIMAAFVASTSLVALLRWLNWAKEAVKAHARAKGEHHDHDAAHSAGSDVTSVGTGAAAIPAPQFSTGEDFKASFAAEVGALHTNNRLE